jgi:hypothetical protein
MLLLGPVTCVGCLLLELPFWLLLLLLLLLLRGVSCLDKFVTIP